MVFNLQPSLSIFSPFPHFAHGVTSVIFKVNLHFQLSISPHFPISRTVSRVSFSKLISIFNFPFSSSLTSPLFSFHSVVPFTSHSLPLAIPKLLSWFSLVPPFKRQQKGRKKAVAPQDHEGNSESLLGGIRVYIQAQLIYKLQK